MASPDLPARPPDPGPRRGVVLAYDARTGWGTVREDTGVEWPFHCTAIADGTRSVEAGVAVTFTLRPGLAGQWEAAGLVT